VRRSVALLCLLLLAGCSAGATGNAYERGRTAFAAGDLRTARVELMNALQSNPDDRAARLLQAQVQLALGDGVAAEAEVTRARQSGVAAAETRHLMAHARLLQGDATGALEEAVGAAPQHRAYAARIRAKSFVTLGNANEAGMEFDRAISLGPDDAALWVDVARFRRGRSNLAGAIEAIDRAVTLQPGNIDALILRGELTRTQYGLAAALPWFDRAIEADGGNVSARLERAITYGDLGRMADMLADIREVHRLTGGHPTAYYLQAALAARANNFVLARALFDRTRGAFDGVPAGQLLAGSIALGNGDAEQAARRVGPLADRQPGNMKAKRLLASAQWQLGNFDAVIITLSPVAARPDADSYSLSLLGRALLRKGDTGAAASILARASRPQLAAPSANPLSDEEFAALRSNGGDDQSQIRLVSALLARGLASEALERAQRLQNASPGAPQVHMLVGDALGALGDHAGAAENYRRAANLAFSEAVALRLIASLERAGQSSAADQVLGLFLQQNPRSVPALLLVAGRSMQAGEWARAIDIYESLRARIGNNDATILNNLAWAYAGAEDHRRALVYARRAYALDPGNPVTADTFGWLLFTTRTDRVRGLALLVGAQRG